MADETETEPETPPEIPQPDAIRVPREAGGLSVLSELDATYASVLGVPRVYVKGKGNERFVTKDPGDLLYFPTDSLHAGKSRYRWEDQGEGVFFGYLIPESDLPKPDTATANVLAKLREFQSRREAAARAEGGMPGA